jgi:hypothetical protein
MDADRLLRFESVLADSPRPVFHSLWIIVQPLFFGGADHGATITAEFTAKNVRPGPEARSHMVETEVETKSLPENAYQPLKPGESYPPIVAAAARLPELTTRSIGWGILLCIIFTVASAYSGLKVGQVMESAIPISILAIGLARLYRGGRACWRT